jgi:F420-0:gamma-glutamyl ligase
MIYWRSLSSRKRAIINDNNAYFAMNIQPVKTRIFRELEELIPFIVEHIPHWEDGSILVVTSKIVALAEGRTRVAATPEEREQIIADESDFVLRTKYTWLTLKDGTVMCSAGIDESNADGKIILLPQDSYVAAEMLRNQLRAHYNIKTLGTLTTACRCCGRGARVCWI